MSCLKIEATNSNSGTVLAGTVSKPNPAKPVLLRTVPGIARTKN